jgi:hypothetical protein
LQPSTDNDLQFRRDRTDGKPGEKQTDQSGSNNAGKQRRTPHRARHDAESKPQPSAADSEPGQQPDQTERDKPRFRSSFFRQIFQ